VIALVLIDEPQGVYYGGQVAGPVMKEMLENILPYLGVKPEYNEDELAMDGVAPIEVGNYVGMEAKSVREELEKLGVGADIAGDGDTIKSQLPSPGEKVNQGSKIILYTQ
jgi:stage V sporulation protein D (sporulation-specific penicillin-binding protein)